MVRVTECSSACMGPVEGGAISSLPPPWFGLRSNNREGTKPHPSTENWIKDLLSMVLPIRTGSSQSISPIRKFP